MLSKIIGVFAIIFLLSIPTTAEAHKKHNRHAAQKPVVPTVHVTIGWTWVEATLLYRAHWRHNHYGRSYRGLQAGPPPPKPHVNSVWVPGHWERRRSHRHWVPGHWR